MSPESVNQKPASAGGFPRPVLFISRCLGFDSCRYNGETIRDPFVEKLKPFVETGTLCPEVEAGLGVPRAPVRIVLHGDRPILYQPATGKDITPDMLAVTEAFRNETQAGEFDGFILKSRSPSCGFKDVKVYKSDGKDPRNISGSGSRGTGFFGGAIAETFMEKFGLPVEDEGRLLNFTIREHFLLRIFTLARFRMVKESNTIQALIDFHTDNKLLFLGMNEGGMRELGRITAAYNKKNLADTLDSYEKELKKTLVKPPSYKAMINSLQHAFGHVSRDLLPKERGFFLNLLEEYRDERIPLSVPVKLIASYAVRFDNGYLLRQNLLSPYPPGITDITDSGKGRDY
ncbi:MAG: DUF1722 domain-containing protein [Spirochaetales bacterium]|nr:MAG: DUF1722 domain-containing protein [Spirochaetales bacterium]